MYPPCEKEEESSESSTYALRYEIWSSTLVQCFKDMINIIKPSFCQFALAQKAHPSPIRKGGG